MPSDKEGRMEETGQAGSFKRAVPQFLASSAQNLILFDNGMVLSFPTIVVAALLGSVQDRLALTAAQATWYVSISYICQPVGSTLSGLLMEPLGRKKSMLLLNVPKFSAWALVYFAPDVPTLYLASAIMGLGVGCTEAPILTYMGEISEARVRGVLTSYAQLCGSLAYVFLYLVALLLEDWRRTAAVCSALPILTALAVSLVPESPWWLASKGRVREAEAALRWLRGWVPAEAVRRELDALVAYHGSQRFVAASADQLPASSTEELLKSKPPLADRLKYYVSKRVRRPFVIICMFFFFYYGSGLACLRPYLVPVFHSMGLEVRENEATLIVSVLGFVGNAVCMVGISYLGKRFLSIAGLLGCAACTLGLALVAFHTVDDPIWGLYFLYGLSFFTGLGVAPIPWMLQSELYPFKGRGVAAGCAAAVSYLIGFLATKTFLGLTDLLALQGVYALYTVLSLAGALYLWHALPETEGKTLEQIEEFFEGDRVARRF